MKTTELEFIRDYKYQGKTFSEWEIECRQAKGYDETGNPAWYKYMSLAEDTMTIAKLIYNGHWPIKK